MKKRLFFYLRLAISLILIAYFASSVDIGLIFRSITPSGWFYIALTFFLVNMDRILMSYKWNILLKAKGIGLPFSEVVRSYYIGTFWGSFLPASVGGDVVRAYRIRGQTKSTGDIVSSIIMERVLGVFATFLVGLLGVSLFVIFIERSKWQLVVGILSIFILFLGLVVLSLNNNLIIWFDHHFQFHKQGWIEKLSNVYHSYQAYQQHRLTMLQFLLWSLLEQCIPILSAFFVAQALNLNVPFWSFFIFIPAILILSRIPISLDGFGFREGLYVFFFSFVGVSMTEAFFLGLLAHTIGIVAVLPGFFYYSFYSPSPAVPQRSLSN